MFARIINLFFSPLTEWTEIAAEATSRKEILKNFLLPLSYVLAATIIIGAWINTAYTAHIIMFALYKIGYQVISLLCGLYVSAFIVSEIMEAHIGYKNHDETFAMMAYSSVAAYLVVICIGLFPFLKEIVVLSLYSFYMYWQGIQCNTNINAIHKNKYMLTACCTILLIFLLMFFISEKLFGAIFLR
jgi:hypothetical protein